MESALPGVAAQMQIKPIEYSSQSQLHYTLTKAELSLLYNEGTQKTIVEEEDVRISGGKIEYLYTMNYTKKNGSALTSGTMFGSVFSDSVEFTQKFSLSDDGYLRWKLVNAKDIQISAKLPIRRLSPALST